MVGKFAVNLIWHTRICTNLQYRCLDQWLHTCPSSYHIVECPVKCEIGNWRHQSLWVTSLWPLDGKTILVTKVDGCMVNVPGQYPRQRQISQEFTNVNSIHWKQKVVNLTILSSLAAPEVVVMTTYGAPGDDKIVKLTFFCFQWYGWTDIFSVEEVIL